MGSEMCIRDRLRGNSVQELLEVHLSAETFEVSDHVEDSRVFAFEAETLHGGFEFSRIDLAGGLGVEEVEGFSEFLDLVFSETWSFHFLFGWSFGSGLLSVGH